MNNQEKRVYLSPTSLPLELSVESLICNSGYKSDTDIEELNESEYDWLISRLVNLKQRVMKTTEKEFYFTPRTTVIAYEGRQMICASPDNTVILDSLSDPEPLTEESYTWDI